MSTLFKSSVVATCKRVVLSRISGATYTGVPRFTRLVCDLRRVLVWNSIERLSPKSANLQTSGLSAQARVISSAMLIAD